MNKLERLPPPPEWDNSKPEIQEKLRRFYTALSLDKSIPDHWNEKNAEGEKPVRKQLLAMSTDHCAYCGKYIFDTEMRVDHYLPKSQFPEIAYAWLNLLPSCDPCNNRRKKTFVPPSLQGKRIVDAVLHTLDAEPQPDFIFDESYAVHQATADRIIDPSYDDPDKHLEFDAFSCEYLPKTEIGRLTIEKFFSHFDTKVWRDLSEEIRDYVKEGASHERIERFIKKYGYEYVGWKAYQYWKEMYRQ